MRPHHGGQVVVLAIAQQTRLDHRAGRDDAGNDSLNQTRAGRADLLCYRDVQPGVNQASQKGVQAGDRHPGKQHPVTLAEFARGQRDPTRAGDETGVVLEALEEVAELE